MGLGLDKECVSCTEFIADTYLIYHTTSSITAKFRLTVYINSIRQQAIVVDIEDVSKISYVCSQYNTLIFYLSLHVITKLSVT